MDYKNIRGKLGSVQDKYGNSEIRRKNAAIRGTASQTSDVSKKSKMVIFIRAAPVPFVSSFQRIYNLEKTEFFEVGVGRVKPSHTMLPEDRGDVCIGHQISINACRLGHLRVVQCE